jgi:hypothetical protein
MICSSLKRLLRTTSSSLALSGPSYMEKSHFRWTNFWGAGHAEVIKEMAKPRVASSAREHRHILRNEILVVKNDI